MAENLKQIPAEMNATRLLEAMEAGETDKAAEIVEWGDVFGRMFRWIAHVNRDPEPGVGIEKITKLDAVEKDHATCRSRTTALPNKFAATARCC